MPGHSRIGPSRVVECLLPTRPLAAIAAALLALGSLSCAPTAATSPAAQAEAPGDSSAASVHTPPFTVTADGYIEKTFEWTYWRFDDMTWHWSTRIPFDLYESYVSRPRANTGDYTVYATDSGDTTIIDDLAHTLADQAASLDLTEQETIHFIATFVQHLAYTVDLDTTGYDDYARYPLETLVAEGGDCEDTAILLGKILHTLGYDVVMVRLPDHMAIGVAGEEGFAGTYYPYKGKKYFYLETTGEGGRIGIVPEEYEGQAAYVFAFTPQPAVSHTWTGHRGETTYDLHVTVENEGTAAAGGLSVFAGFDAGDDRVWNEVQSDTFDLAPQESIDLDLTLMLPTEKHTRLLVYVLRDGEWISASNSGWFDQ